MSLRKMMMIAMMLCLPFAGMVSADWHSFSDSRQPANLQVNVLNSDDQEVRMEIVVPGYHMDFVKAGAQSCVMINIPGAVWHMEKACPTLPQMGELVRINNFSAATLEVISKEEVEIDLPAAIIPSKGQLTRDINPETVAIEFGPIYHENAFYIAPEKQFSIGEEFILRDVRGVRLSVIPVTANHVTMKARILKKAVVVIKQEGQSRMNVFSRMETAPSADFEEIYSGAFVNYNQSKTFSARNTLPAEQNKKLVVLVASDFQAATANWIEFKKSKGYDVTVKTVSGDSADSIKSYLQNLWNTNKFGYVVLVGDIDRIPTLRGKKERALSDRCYVRLEGNDNYADAFISRISGNNETEITTQFNKIMNYEKGAKNGAWCTSGVTIASNEGSPRDWERAKWLINGGGENQKTPIVKGGLKATGFNKFAEIYDPSANPTMVAEALNGNGASVICYIGHGSTDSWASSRFSTSHVKQLRNGEMLPVIWSVACVNGKFDARECFAEAWLRQPNGGAVAFEGATTNEEWVPPCDKQAATINAYINNTHRTFGALEGVGCVEGMKKWGDGDSTSGNMMAEQCTLFGDCTMEVYYPKKSPAVETIVE